MKKLIKIIGVLAVVLVAAAGAVLIAAKFLITPERVRKVVIPMAEERINRPVSMGDINVRVFSGIVISDFMIGSKEDTKEEFVSAKALVLRYRFWPLLRFSVVMDEIRLESPEIHIVRYDNGEFNFSDLLAQESKDKDTITESGGGQVDGTKDGRQIDLVVNELSISDGRLFFIDHMVDRKFQMTDLSASMSGFSRYRTFPVNLSAKINNAPVNLSGVIDSGNVHVTVAIRVKDLDMAVVMPYMPEDFPAKVSSLILSMELKAEATKQSIGSSGRIILNELDLLFDDMPDVAVENAKITLDYDMVMDMVSENLAIRKADADINGILFNVAGKVLSYAKGPVLDITARMPMMAVSDFIASLQAGLAEPVVQMRPSGRIGALFHLKGSPDQPEALVEQGNITLETVGFNMGQLLPEINGDIRVSGDTAASDNMVIHVAGDFLHVEFTASNLLGKMISINNTITAHQLDIDRLIASMGMDRKKDEKRPSDTAPDKVPDKSEEPGPLEIPAHVTGEVRVGHAVFRGLDILNFELQYLLKDNMLTVNHFRGNVAGGKISGISRAEINRKPIAYTADISLEDTRVENILKVLYPAAENTVFGNMFLKADIKGEGTAWETISQKLTFRADLIILDGRVSGKGLAGGLAAFLGSDRLEVLEFDSLKGNMKLKDGQIILDSRFAGREVRMAPTGTIGLDGLLNLSLGLQLAPSIASGIRIGNLYSQVMQTGDNWTLVPLGVGGTLQAPRFNLDTSVVSDQLLERGKEEVRKQVKDKLLDRLVPQSPEKSGEETDQGKQAPVERRLEDTLRRLFN